MEELLRRSQMLIQLEFRVLEIFTVAALYYLVLTSLWGLVQRRIEARLARGYVAVRAPQADSPTRVAEVHAGERAVLEQDQR
jgi:polar amino acid transport system permease protein